MSGVERTVPVERVDVVEDVRQHSAQAATKEAISGAAILNDPEHRVAPTMKDAAAVPRFVVVIEDRSISRLNAVTAERTVSALLLQQNRAVLRNLRGFQPVHMLP